MSEKVIVSPLGKTWLLDLDGTILKHNGYRIDGQDTLLEGAKEFLQSIPPEDKIVFLTSRAAGMGEATEGFLQRNGICYHTVIYDLPFGERILLNDKKPSGLPMAIAVNTDRDSFMQHEFVVDGSL